MLLPPMPAPGPRNNAGDWLDPSRPVRASQHHTASARAAVAPLRCATGCGGLVHAAAAMRAFSLSFAPMWLTWAQVGPALISRVPRPDRANHAACALSGPS
jgi:hypothetical protein